MEYGVYYICGYIQYMRCSVSVDGDFSVFIRALLAPGKRMVGCSRCFGRNTNIYQAGR